MDSYSISANIYTVNAGNKVASARGNIIENIAKGTTDPGVDYFDQ